MPHSTRDQVFMSYSHKDREWMERLRTMSMPLVRTNRVSVWDDAKNKSRRELERRDQRRP
jgi:hypothetical protein